MDAIYDASTLDRWDAACRDVLKNWLEWKFIYLPEDPVKEARRGYRYGPISSDDLEWSRKNTYEDSDLPPEVVEEYNKQVKQAKFKVQSAVGLHKAQLDTHKKATDMVAASPGLKTLSNGKTVPRSWLLVRELAGGEYMEVELIDAKDARSQFNDYSEEAGE